MYSITFEIPSGEMFEKFMNVIRHYGFLQFMTSSQRVHAAPDGQGAAKKYKVPDAFTRNKPYI